MLIQDDIDSEIFDALFSYTDIDPGENAPDTHTNNTQIRPSYEQQLVINHLLDGDNVVVDSVSGSGKSTTILSCAEQMSETPVLQLTYNSMLRKEVREKVVSRQIENVAVHTYHSLAVMYYHKDAHKDNIMRKIIATNAKPAKLIPPFRLVFLDESQDMTFLYFMFIVKFLKDAGTPIQLCIMGDYKQGIYQFKGSDIRFLTRASQIWSVFMHLSSPTFHHCSLTMSYRITDTMGSFVNHVLLGSERLKTCKPGTPVFYIRKPSHHMIIIAKSKIAQLLDGGELPGDIFVLYPSDKLHIIRKLENFLVERNIPCYIAMTDGEIRDERVISGKVVFSTFHAVKGRERKHVFLFGFDQSYFRFYAPDLPTNECPNTIYVACTRATHNLYVFENAESGTDRPLSFLQKTHFEMIDSPYIEFQGHPQKHFRDGDETDRKYHDVTPTKLIRFIPESVIDELTPILEQAFLVETEAYPELELEIPVVVHTTMGFYEDVSDLNGIAIPSIYYDHLFKRFPRENVSDDDHQQTQVGAQILLGLIHAILDTSRPNDYQFLKRMVANLPTTISTPEEYLYLSNLYSSVAEKLYFRLKQIGENDYGWLSRDMIQECIERMDETVGVECVSDKDILIEYPIIDTGLEEDNAKINEILLPFFEPGSTPFRFSARIDLVTPKNVWELKCTSAITMEHQLQLVLYAWLWAILRPDTPREYRIFNIRSGEIQRFEASFETITHIVVALLKGKYDKLPEKTDDEFIAECREFILFADR
jgi:hypothetical protein